MARTLKWPENKPSPDSAERPASGLGGTRAQAMQRLQVGIGGLAAMVLLVGFANTILQQARKADDPAATTTVQAKPDGTGPAVDPLVDIGVAPELPPEEVIVPDLPAEQMVSEEPGRNGGPATGAGQRTGAGQGNAPATPQ